MSSSITSCPQIDSFLQGEKNLTLPFDLISVHEHASTKYVCTKILRILPKKRLVLLAHVDDQQVVLKLFSAKHKGHREYDNEVKGSEAVTKTNVKTPALIEKSQNINGCFAVVYEYIKAANSFNLNNPNKTNSRITSLLNSMAELHQHGIYQDDIHLDNILLVDEEIHLIDVGSIKISNDQNSLDKETSLKNLTKLFAQFYQLDQTNLVGALEIYYQVRNWSVDNVNQEQTIEAEIKKFDQLLSSAWKKRKQNYLSKCFRTCSMTKYEKTFSYEYAFRSDFIAKLDNDFIKNIDRLIETGSILKAGNSATVVKVNIQKKPVLIKRYNIKSFSHFLKRFWRPTRASHSWENANLLEFIGLKTPRPYGFIEKRIGWFRGIAYFISEYIESEELLSVYEHRKPTANELEQIKAIFWLLQNDRISHGDLKAQNLLLDKTGIISLIDLDAMTEHTTKKSFEPAFLKDKERFIRNWQDQEVKDIFETLLF